MIKFHTCPLIRAKPTKMRKEDFQNITTSVLPPPPFTHKKNKKKASSSHFSVAQNISTRIGKIQMNEFDHGQNDFQFCVFFNNVLIPLPPPPHTHTPYLCIIK